MSILNKSLRGHLSYFSPYVDLSFSPCVDTYLVLVPAWTCLFINLYVGMYLFKSPV